MIRSSVLVYLSLCASLCLLAASGSAPYGWPDGWSAPRALGTGLADYGYRVTELDGGYGAYWVEDTGDGLVIAWAQSCKPEDRHTLHLPWDDVRPAPGEVVFLPASGLVYWFHSDIHQWHLYGAEVDLRTGDTLQVGVIHSSDRRMRDLTVTDYGEGHLCVWAEYDAGALQVRAAALDGLLLTVGPRTVHATRSASRTPSVAVVSDTVLLAWADRRLEDINEVMVSVLDEELGAAWTVTADEVRYRDDVGRPRVTPAPGSAEEPPRFLITWSGAELAGVIPTERSRIVSAVATVDGEITLHPPSTAAEARGLTGVFLAPHAHVSGGDIFYSWSRQVRNPRYARTDVVAFFGSGEISGAQVGPVSSHLLTYELRSAWNPVVGADSEGVLHYFWYSVRAGGEIEVFHADTATEAHITRWNVLGIDADNIIVSAGFQTMLAATWAVVRMARDGMLLLGLCGLVLLSFTVLGSALQRIPGILFVASFGLLYSGLSYLGVWVIEDVRFWGLDAGPGAAPVAACVTLLLTTALFLVNRRGSTPIESPLSALGYLVLWAFWSSYFQLLFVPLALR